MTKINERKLIEAVAKAHLGDAEICKKLGFEYPKKCGELLIASSAWNPAN